MDYRAKAKKWYRSSRWQKIREQQLARHPYCQCPLHKGTKIPAKIVDHIKPHKGDSRMFWNQGNLQSLTKLCHDSWKKTLEQSGIDKGCNEDGIPMDKDHPWNV